MMTPRTPSKRFSTIRSLMIPKSKSEVDTSQMAKTNSQSSNTSTLSSTSNTSHASSVTPSSMAQNRAKLLALAEAMTPISGASTTGRGRRRLTDAERMNSTNSALSAGTPRSRSTRRSGLSSKLNPPFDGGKDTVTKPTEKDSKQAFSDRQRAKTATDGGTHGVKKQEDAVTPPAASAFRVKSKAAQQETAGTQKKTKQKISLKDHLLRGAGTTEKKKDPGGELECAASYLFHAAASDDDDDDDDDSDDSDFDDSSDEGGHKTPVRGARGRGVHRQWSCGAFSVVSAGDATIQTNLYLEDTSNSEAANDTDDEKDLVRPPKRGEEAAMKKGRKKKKLSGERRAPRRSTKGQRKKEKEMEDAMAAVPRSPVIPETDNEEDSEDDDEPSLLSPVQGGHHRHTRSRDDYDLVSPYKVPAMCMPRSPSGELTLDEHGYNSDTALVRRRVDSFRMLLEGSTGLNDIDLDDLLDEGTPRASPKEKKKKKKQSSTGVLNDAAKKARRSDRARARKLRKRQKRLMKKAAKAAAKADRLEALGKGHARTDENSAKAHSDNEDEDIYLADNGSTKSKRSDYSIGKKEKKDVTRRMRELDSCFQEVDKKAAGVHKRKSFDERFSEVEKFEAMLSEERDALHKERETIAFERESLEMQLNDEIQRSESLKLQVIQLEQQLQSQRFSNAGNDFRSQHERNIEMEQLKEKYEKEKSDLTRRLLEKDSEIQDLKHELKEMKILEEKKGSQSDMTDGKSKERLQGELLQTVAKLTERDARLHRQATELEAMREELTALQEGSGVNQLKEDIADLKKAKRETEQELYSERKENTQKLKEKDDTISYLMSELARLKKEQTALTMNTNTNTNSRLSSAFGLSLSNHSGRGERKMNAFF